MKINYSLKNFQILVIILLIDADKLLLVNENLHVLDMLT